MILLCIVAIFNLFSYGKIAAELFHLTNQEKVLIGKHLMRYFLASYALKLTI